MANLVNPKEELKARSEQYAKYIEYGLARVKRKLFPKPSESEKLDLSPFKEKSLWELWLQSNIHQYYLTQWGLQQPNSPELHAMIKFLLQLSQTSEYEDEFGAALAENLGSALSDASKKADCVAMAKKVLPAIHQAAKAAPYDTKAFMDPLSELLTLVPGASITCADFISQDR
jgi:hypothetical protein